MSFIAFVDKTLLSFLVQLSLFFRQTLILTFGANDALYRNRISNDGITKITEILLKLLIQNLMIDNVSL